MAGEEITNQGNIKPEFNTANAGLNLDQSQNQILKGKLTYALNAAVENFDANSVNYQNEPGNELCLNFPEGFHLIGEHFIQERAKHIFFLANPETGDSQIGYMDNNDCVYRIYVDDPCLNFNIQHPIHKAVHKISNCNTEIYWTDGYNPRRYLDIDNIPYILQSPLDLCDPQYTNRVDCNQLKIQPNFSIPQLEVVDINTGGNLTAGTYQFAIQYSDPSGNGYTSYYSITNPTPIADPQLTTINFDYPVGKSIDVGITNLDVTGKWQYYNLAVIKTVNAITSVELIGTYFIDGLTNTITYTGQNVTNIRLSINDIFEKFPYYEIAQDITSARDILIWDNLTSIDRINYQQIANNISLQWQTYKIPADENYADELNATNLRGYMRDEVYAFEIVFLLKNGKQTDGFHIPGRVSNNNDVVVVPTTNADFIGEPDYYVGTTGYSPWWKIYNTATVLGAATGNNIGNAVPHQYGDFAYWESTELYPCNEEVWGNLANTPIRHHKFPDVAVSPIFESALFVSPGTMVMQKDAVFPIGVRIDVSQVATLIASSGLTQEQKDNIAGFKIVRGDRNTNKSIVAKGILRNVAKYNREGTDYYFANYPYNDLREDPFLYDKSNSFSPQTQSVPGSNAVCRTFRILTTGAGQVEYTDCTSQSVITLDVQQNTPVTVCGLDFPKPKILGTTGIAVSETYTVYKITSNDPGGTTLSYYNPFNCAPSACYWNTLTGNLAAPPAPYSSWDQYCINNLTNVCCGPNATQKANITVYSTTGPRYIWSLTAPVYVSGSNDYEVEEIQFVGGQCDPELLDTYSSEAAKYRMVFNSPETSFGQPFLGNVLKLENVMFGAGKAHFVQVKKNALYKLITKEAQQDALNSAAAIANITSPINASALFAAYQAYLTIYINGITRRNYGYSFNSIASYDYSANIDNNATSIDGYLGVKQRPIEIKQYLISGVQSAGDDNNINNWNRESSVYIKTTDDSGTFDRAYFTYRICNTNVLPNPQTFSYTDPVAGASTITINAANCSTIDSFTYPVKTSGNANYTISVISSTNTTITSNTPPLPFPSQTPTLASGGSSLVVDNSRFTLSSSGRAQCGSPEKQVDINVVSYYASLKNIFVNQWGQIYSYKTIDTGFQRNVIPYSTTVYNTVFGGDTFINKFAFKTKLPFFIDNRVNAPDDSDIYYDEIGNVAYPRYWHSARSVLSNGTAIGIDLTNFISVKARNLDCINSQVPKEAPGRTYYDGKMYLFAYGVPYFYCESSYNVDLRQAFNNREGDFWPHVNNNIPDDWVQESYVPIAQDNTYYYNNTFSKQNTENEFTHLPVDWEQKLCYTNFPFRAVYSDPQNISPDNKVNNWLIYRPVSYFDFPQNYGRLTSLDGIENKGVLARFDNKSLLYNRLLTIDTSNPQAAYIGNPSLFAGAPPIDFAETDLGFVGSQHKMLLKIPQGQVTIDAKRGQVFLISGNGIKDLSAFGSGMNRWFTDHLAFEILKHFPDVDIDNHFNGLGLHGVFDSKYDRIIITKLDYVPKSKNIKYDAVTEEFYIEEVYPQVAPASTTTTSSTTTSIPGTTTSTTTIAPLVRRVVVYLTDEEYFCNKSWTVSFNLNTNSWISFHSYLPNWYVAENNFFYSGLNDCCSNFDALVAVMNSNTTTTSTSSTSTTSTSSTSTTSTTTTAFTGCDLAGTAYVIDCELDGTAYEVVPTTTSTTTLACLTCNNYTLSNNSGGNVTVNYINCGESSYTSIVVFSGVDLVVCACTGSVIDPSVIGFTITEGGACTTTTTTTVTPYYYYLVTRYTDCVQSSSVGEYVVRSISPAPFVWLCGDDGFQYEIVGSASGPSYDATATASAIDCASLPC